MCCDTGPYKHCGYISSTFITQIAIYIIRAKNNLPFINPFLPVSLNEVTQANGLICIQYALWHGSVDVLFMI